VVAGFLAGAAVAQVPAGEAKLAAQDLEFAQEAAIGGLTEVTLGELALQKPRANRSCSLDSAWSRITGRLTRS
jgi:hypothetical protein